MNFSVKPISDFVKKVKKKYKEAYERGEQRPAAQAAKAQIKHGAGDGIY